MATLVIEKVIMHESPQWGTYLYYFEAWAGDSRGVFHVPGDLYKGDGIIIEMNLQIPKVNPDAQVNWVMRLDDDEPKVITNEADNKCSGTFTATSVGSQTYNPEDEWRFTIHWHID